MWKGDVRMLLACHTQNVYVFSLERDTCFLIVVSQGKRNSFLLEFINEWMKTSRLMNEWRRRDWFKLQSRYLRRWVDEKRLDSQCVRTYVVYRTWQLPKKQQGTSVNSMFPLPFTSVCRSSEVWHLSQVDTVSLLRLRNIACCRKRYLSLILRRSRTGTV